MRISIITPTLNSSNTISSCIESISLQTHDDIEHIIIDGGSNDGTIDIINEYQRNNSRFFVKYISEKDNGIYDALNKGIVISSGEVIGILHSDDLFADNSVLSKISKLFSSDSSIEGCYGDLCYVSASDTGKVIRQWKAGEYKLKSFVYGWMPPHPTCFFRKGVYERYGGFDTYYKISGDYELILRFLYKNTINMFYLPEVITLMRFGGRSNGSIKNILSKMREDAEIMKKYGLPFYFSLPLKSLRKIHQFFIK